MYLQRVQCPRQNFYVEKSKIELVYFDVIVVKMNRNI